MPPNCPQIDPKCPQTDPKLVLKDPKWTLNAPQLSLNDPKWALNDPKVPPFSYLVPNSIPNKSHFPPNLNPNLTPNGPKRTRSDPETSDVTPTLQFRPFTPNLSRICPQMPPKAPNCSHSAPQKAAIFPPLGSPVRPSGAAPSPSERRDSAWSPLGFTPAPFISRFLSIFARFRSVFPHFVPPCGPHKMAAAAMRGRKMAAGRGGASAQRGSARNSGQPEVGDIACQTDAT